MSVSVRRMVTISLVSAGIAQVNSAAKSSYSATWKTSFALVQQALRIDSSRSFDVCLSLSKQTRGHKSEGHDDDDGGSTRGSGN